MVVLSCLAFHGFSLFPLITGESHRVLYFHASLPYVYIINFNLMIVNVNFIVFKKNLKVLK